MNNERVKNIKLSNIFTDGIGLIGTLFTSAISLMLTVLCCISDYSQISILIDTVLHESQSTVIITSLTIVFFLNFSMFIAATIIKRISSGITPKSVLSILSVAVAFVLFLACFFVTFQFRWSMKDSLFSLNNGVDGVVNKAVNDVAKTIESNFSTSVNEGNIIFVAGILTGSMPAFTSLLSLLSVFLFYDPVANNKAKMEAKLLVYKYRAYLTSEKIAAIDREISALKKLPKLYEETIQREQKHYQDYVDSLCEDERRALVAHYTAATEVFKNDQNIVTELSHRAKSIAIRNPLTIQREPKDIEPLPNDLQEQILDSKRYFDEQVYSYQTSRMTMDSKISEFSLPLDANREADTLRQSNSLIEEIAIEANNNSSNENDMTLLRKDETDSLRSPFDSTESAAVNTTPSPDSFNDPFVATWLQTAANQ